MKFPAVTRSILSRSYFAASVLFAVILVLSGVGESPVSGQVTVTVTTTVVVAQTTKTMIVYLGERTILSTVSMWVTQTVATERPLAEYEDILLVYIGVVAVASFIGGALFGRRLSRPAGVTEPAED